MLKKFNPTNVLQIGLLILLIVSIGQVAFWIIDQVNYTNTVRDEFLSVLISTDPNEESTIYSQSYIEKLYEDSESRINRVIWEGSFFLLVLIIGIGILTVTIRREYDLRKRQQNFLAAISHELKSPLASIRISAEAILLDKPSSRYNKRINRVLSDVDRLLRMIDNLLDTSKIESGKVTIKKEKVYLKTVIESCISNFSEDLLENINISLNLDKELDIYSDRLILESIIANIIDNSIKSCNAAKSSNIEIKGECKNNSIILAIKDDGMGYPIKDNEMIFEKFYRSGDELVRSMPGSGLGLYIVKKLVSLLDGKIISMSDGINKGAIFIITWPIE